MVLPLSCLQLGTTTVSLQGLLRQGREFCELLVEAPIMQLNSGSSQQSSAVPGQHAEPQARQPLQLGHLVLRLINIGREPSNAAAKTPDFDAAQLGAKSTGKKVSKLAMQHMYSIGEDLLSAKIEHNKQGHALLQYMKLSRHMAYWTSAQTYGYHVTRCC